MAIMSLIPCYFLENNRKIKPEKLPSCSIAGPLIAYIYTQQLEILVSVPELMFSDSDCLRPQGQTPCAIHNSICVRVCR